MKISNIKLRLAGFLSLASFTIGLPSCSFFNSFDEGPTSNVIEINSLSLAKSTLETQIGAMEYVSVSVKPSKEQKNISLKWDYDASIIECDKFSNWGVTIKGLAEGQNSLRCSYGGYEAHCLVTVKGFAENYEVTREPYIYSNYSVLQTSPGVSEKVFVSLYGGDVSDIDGYTWTVDNSADWSVLCDYGKRCRICKNQNHAHKGSLSVLHGRVCLCGRNRSTELSFCLILSINDEDP